MARERIRRKRERVKDYSCQMVVSDIKLVDITYEAKLLDYK